MNTLLPQQLLVRPDRHDPDPLVIYHARCADGFGAALAAWLYDSIRKGQLWSSVYFSNMDNLENLHKNNA